MNRLTRDARSEWFEAQISDLKPSSESHPQGQACALIDQLPCVFALRFKPLS